MSAAVVLSGRLLDSVPEGAVGAATISLCLSFNGSLRVLSLPKLSQLERLDVSRCALSSLPNLGNIAPRLSQLNVAHNPLLFLTGLQGCNALRELWAHDCSFRDAPALGTLLGGLGALRIAILYACPAAAVTSDSRWLVAAVPQLEKFALCSPRIEVVTDDLRRDASKWFNEAGIRFNQDARRIARSSGPDVTTSGSASGDSKARDSDRIDEALIIPARSVSVPCRVVKPLPRARKKNDRDTEYTGMPRAVDHRAPADSSDASRMDGDSAMAAASSARARLSMMLANIADTLPDLSERAEAVGMGRGRGSGAAAVRAKGVAATYRKAPKSPTSQSSSLPATQPTAEADNAPKSTPPAPPTQHFVRKSRLAAFGASGEIVPWESVGADHRANLLGVDGGPIELRWPSGAVAVRVEPDQDARDGVRLRTTAYARENSSRLSVVWSSKGNGFIMGLSGATLLSTGEDGAGFHADAAGKVILRRWGPKNVVNFVSGSYRDGAGPAASPQRVSPPRARPQPPMKSGGPQVGGDGVISRAMAASLEANDHAAAIMARAAALIAAHSSAPPPMDASIPTNPRAAAASDEMAIESAIAHTLGLSEPTQDRPHIPTSLNSEHGAGFIIGQHLGVVLVFPRGGADAELHILYAVRNVRIIIILATSL
jgi:hypothetical protein